jgi:hypothetical protein
MRKEIRITAEQKAVFVRDDGAIFYVMMEPSGLWLHVAAPAGKSPGSIEFEPNCGNEGWVHCELREPVRTRIPLRQVRQ